MTSSLSPVVIKVGGALLENPHIASQLLSEIKALRASRPVVLVHGGGVMVEMLLSAMSLTSAKIDGLRVTPDEQMPYVAGALAGSANKNLCALAIKAGITPVGLSLMDAGMTKCTLLDEKYGAVGVPSVGDPYFLQQLFSTDCLPVISSIGCTGEGRLMNVNADQAATTIAQLVGGTLLLLSNVEGVLDSSRALISTLDLDRIDKEINKGVIQDGMLVKVEAAMQAAQLLNTPVTIASWSASLSAILNNQTGTQVVPSIKGSGE